MSDRPESVVRSGARERPYSELLGRVARIAGGLHALGVGESDRVAVIMRNEPAFLEVSAAIGVLGASPVPVNWHWRGEELAYLLTDSSSKAVFAHADLLGAVEAATPDGVPIIEVAVPAEVAESYGVHESATAPSGRHPDLDTWMAGFEPWHEPPTSPPISVIYTSGTTGRPKGVVREASDPERRQSMVGMVLRYFGLDPSMSTLIPAPLYHTAPNTHGMFAVALGIDVTLMPRFDAEEFLRLVERHRIEHAQMVPTMFVRMLALPEEVRARYDITSLKAVVHAAAPCPAHVKEAMIEWLGPILHEYYGGTESGIVVYCDSEQWLAHRGTVGRAVEDADVRICGPDGEERPAGEVGEVYLKPPSVWPQFTYLGDPEKRASIERDGYITIGDVGYLDEDGFLHLTDRANDMVISGGVNIYPVEIEQAILALGGVRDVAVFGIPDDQFGEALAAHIEADPAAGLTEDAVRDHVRAELAGYKVPRVIVFDDDLPREDSGKLFKRRIRDRYWTDAGRSI